MKIQGDDCYLELKKSGLRQQFDPASRELLIDVNVKVFGYTAEDLIRVTAEDYESFLADLEQLEKQRQGNASLKGASSGDFYLEFFITDDQGHIGLRGHTKWKTPHQHPIKLQFSFGIDPDRLPEILDNMRSLKS